MPILRFSFIVILTVAVAACSFQLRGTQRALNKSFANVNLVLHGNDYAFESALNQTLRSSRINVNGASENLLEILSTRNQKRTASYSSRAKSAEFELIKTVTFRVKREKNELIAPMRLETRRSYLYRETAAVGKAEEELLLRQEMDKDLAQRILLAMQRVADVRLENPQQPAPETTSPQAAP